MNIQSSKIIIYSCRALIVFMTLVGANLFLLFLPAVVQLFLRGNAFLILLISFGMFGWMGLALLSWKAIMFFPLTAFVFLLILPLSVSGINGGDGHCQTFFSPVILNITKKNTQIFPGRFPTLERRLKPEYLQRCMDRIGSD